MPESRPFLGVERSFTGRVWRDRLDARGSAVALAIGQRHGLPELLCRGGQMRGRLVLDTDEKRKRAAKMGVKDLKQKYAITDMVRGDCLVAATVTNRVHAARGRIPWRPHSHAHLGDALGHRHRALG